MPRAARAPPALLFLFAHAVAWAAAASMKKDLSRATANKTLDLVVALKQDLRKNNDDYRDLRAQPPLNPYLGGHPPAPSDMEGNALDSRRNNEKNDEQRNATTVASVVSTGLTAKPAVGQPSRRAGHYAQLHQLLDKEGLLQKFLRNIPAPKRRPAGLRQRAFNSDEFFPPPPETLASNELDMLAATGEKIDTLKRRGRLCHRHVLFPEGPKYDSRGAAYLKPHRLDIDFRFTRRPKLLLPRCCNCCQKSVLGCE